MGLEDKLSQIRTNSDMVLTTQEKSLRVLFVFILGAILGFLAKYTDGSVVGEIGTYLGFWILVTTMLIAWSRSPEAAALHAFVFLAAMLSVYYIYSMVLFGFFSRHYFTAWGSIVLLSPIGGYVVWYARGDGWKAAFCAALPISLLLAEGYSFIYTFSIPRGFALFSAVLLFMIVPTSCQQRLRVLPIVSFIFFIIERFELMYLLPG